MLGTDTVGGHQCPVVVPQGIASEKTLAYSLQHVSCLSSITMHFCLLLLKLFKSLFGGFAQHEAFRLAVGSVLHICQAQYRDAPCQSWCLVLPNFL